MPSGLKKNKKEGSNINIYIYYKCLNAVIFLKKSLDYAVLKSLAPVCEVVNIT